MSDLISGEEQEIAVQKTTVAPKHEADPKTSWGVLLRGLKSAGGGLKKYAGEALNYVRGRGNIELEARLGARLAEVEKARNEAEAIMVKASAEAEKTRAETEKIRAETAINVARAQKELGLDPTLDLSRIDSRANTHLEYKERASLDQITQDLQNTLKMLQAQGATVIVKDPNTGENILQIGAPPTDEFDEFDEQLYIVPQDED